MKKIILTGSFILAGTFAFSQTSGTSVPKLADAAGAESVPADKSKETARPELKDGAESGTAKTETTVTPADKQKTNEKADKPKLGDAETVTPKND